MKKILIGLGMVLVMVLAGFLLVLVHLPNRSVEPRFEGRAFSEWQDDFTEFRSIGEHKRGERALLAIGTNAIPYLLGELQVNSTPMKTRLITWAMKQRLLLPLRIRFGVWRNPPLSEEGHHARALSGFVFLGSTAQSALPALAELVKRPDTALNATKILARYDNAGKLYFGSEVFVPLLVSLTNQNPEVRRIAADALGLTQTNTSVVVSALLRTLHDPNPEARATAAMSLGEGIYQEEAATIIPALINCLNDTNGLVRARAAKRLGLLGANARSALPALSRVLTDVDGEVRLRATTAINQIDPEAAASVKTSPVATRQ